MAEFEPEAVILCVAMTDKLAGPWADLRSLSAFCINGRKEKLVSKGSECAMQRTPRGLPATICTNCVVSNKSRPKKTGCRVY
jgi:hypothetical protein